MVDVLIIGGGLIGSAAARHLSAFGAAVVLVDPGEPADWAHHDGLFASHYDAGRTTRSLDKDPVWGRLAQRSIARYRTIEASSGIPFFEPRGFLHVGPVPKAPGDLLARVEAVGTQLGAVFERIDAEALQQRFPYLHIRPGAMGLYEPHEAGVLNPRALIRAQQATASRHGAILLHGTAVSAHRTSNGFEVRTAEGGIHRGRRLLLATGAYTNQFDLLHPRLDLDVRVETVWLERVSPADLERLREMPAIWYDFDKHAAFPYAYLLPPVRYPDGHHYIKIGVDRDPDAGRDTRAGINAFFRSGGHMQRGLALRALLHTLLPDLPLHEGHTKPCVLTYTPHGYPMVDAVGPDGVFVAVGGCGGAAKSSDEIGRMVALLVHKGTWAHDLDATLFSACFR